MIAQAAGNSEAHARSKSLPLIERATEELLLRYNPVRLVVLAGPVWLLFSYLLARNFDLVPFFLLVASATASMRGLAVATHSHGMKIAEFLGALPVDRGEIQRLNLRLARGRATTIVVLQSILALSLVWLSCALQIFELEPPAAAVVGTSVARAISTSIDLAVATVTAWAIARSACTLAASHPRFGLWIWRLGRRPMRRTTFGLGSAVILLLMMVELADRDLPFDRGVCLLVAASAIGLSILQAHFARAALPLEPSSYGFQGRSLSLKKLGDFLRVADREPFFRRFPSGSNVWIALLLSQLSGARRAVWLSSLLIPVGALAAMWVHRTSHGDYVSWFLLGYIGVIGPVTYFALLPSPSAALTETLWGLPLPINKQKLVQFLLTLVIAGTAHLTLLLLLASGLLQRSLSALGAAEADRLVPLDSLFNSHTAALTLPLLLACAWGWAMPAILLIWFAFVANSHWDPLWVGASLSLLLLMPLFIPRKKQRQRIPERGEPPSHWLDHLMWLISPQWALLRLATVLPGLLFYFLFIDNILDPPRLEEPYTATAFAASPHPLQSFKERLGVFPLGPTPEELTCVAHSASIDVCREPELSQWHKSQEARRQERLAQSATAGLKDEHSQLYADSNQTLARFLARLDLGRRSRAIDPSDVGAFAASTWSPEQFAARRRMYLEDPVDWRFSASQLFESLSELLSGEREKS